MRRQIKNALGFKPHNVKLYRQALIHRSTAVLQPSAHKVNNERLEFLGDSVLSAVVTSYLYQHFPDKQEGFLTQLRSKVVSRNCVNSTALCMGIDGLLQTNHLKVSPHHTNIYGNALEALIGATFLDKGFNFAKRVIVNNILAKHVDLQSMLQELGDCKSRMIEYCQKRRVTVEFVSLEDTLASKHEPQFTTEVLANGRRIALGHGVTKKDAEQNAARQAMEVVERRGILL